MTIVGCDVSSYRVDLAWVNRDGRPAFWHQELAGGKHDNELIDRIRRIRIEWPGGSNAYVEEGWDVTHIAIEYPYARGNGIPALWTTVGVITRQAPRWAEVGWPEPRAIRAALGIKDKKTLVKDALYYLPQWPVGVPTGLLERDEHELDALATCIGWTLILRANGDIA